MAAISFTSDGCTLDGAIFYPPERKEKHPAILFVHGWTSDKARSVQYARALSRIGQVCFLFDMRGHGTSEGDRTVTTPREFLNDVLAAYDYLFRLEGVDTENISGIGSSFGGYLLALLTEKRDIKNLVLRAPADYPDELFDVPKVKVPGGHPPVVEWRREEKSADATFALTALHHFKGNVLLIESENDDKIPHQTIVNFMNALPDPSSITHILMNGAPHSIKEGPFRDQVCKVLTEWFGEL